MPDRDLIAEGRRLLAAATPGRWLVYAAFSDSSAQVSTAEFGPVCVVGNRDAVGGGVPAAADAELIAYTHNTYGPLLDELEQARAAFERLQRETQQDYVAIAAKQERDAQALNEARARIAELEADSRACKAGLVEHQDFVNGLIYERDIAVERVAELEQAGRRVIETVDELEALPIGAIVLHTPCSDGEPCLWYRIGDDLTAAPWTDPDRVTFYDHDDVISHGHNEGEWLIVIWQPEVDRG